MGADLFDILTQIQYVSFSENVLKMPFAKCQPLCSGVPVSIKKIYQYRNPIVEIRPIYSRYYTGKTTSLYRIRTQTSVIWRPTSENRAPIQYKDVILPV